MDDNAELANRRDSLRRRRLKSAKLVFNNASSVIDCVLRDISDTGAKLETENAAHLPRSVILKVGEDQSFDCEVMWRSERQLGVRFRNNDSLRHLSGFMASMVQDLHMPLGAIVSFAEAIDAGGFGPVGHPKYSRQLRRIIDGGRALTVAINDLLAMSSVDAGKIETHDVLIDVAPLVEAAVALAAEFADNRGAEVTLDLPETLPRIRGSEIKLQQILVSLISDATAKAADGGRVRIAAGLDPAGNLDIAVDRGGADMAAVPPSAAPMAVVGGVQAGGGVAGLGLAQALGHGAGVELLTGRIAGGDRARMRISRERIVR